MCKMGEMSVYGRVRRGELDKSFGYGFAALGSLRFSSQISRASDHAWHRE